MAEITATTSGTAGALTRERLVKWAPLLVLGFLILLFPVFEWLEDFRDGKDHIYLLDSAGFSRSATLRASRWRRRPR